MAGFPFYFSYVMIALLRKQAVYNLFKEYFGEDRVDMQGNNILVWWPELRVSNEREEFCYIKNLYARVTVDNNGSLGGTFNLNRTEYTYEEWVSSYCHSHVPRIYRTADGVREWRNPCLGSGPIRETCCTLNAGYDEDVWRLFIFELDQYVRHESVEGVPHIRLNTIGIDIANNRTQEWKIPVVRTQPFTYHSSSMTTTFNTLVNGLIQQITKVKPFRFNYVDGCYGVAENPLDIVVKVSDIFIDWYNTLPRQEQDSIMSFLRQKEFFRKCKIVNNKIMIEVSVRNNSTNYHLELEGTNVMTFKGQEKRLVITHKPGDELSEFTENYLNLLDPDIVMYIIHRILRTINYRFNGSDKERTARTKEAVRYI